MIVLKSETSLPDLPERPSKDFVLTPRSREACMSEGIDLSELVYRHLEEFADRQLSPRIVKLRYDYFEAKRKDLMVLAIEARDKLLQSRKSLSGTRSSKTISSISTSESGSSDWGMLNIEREKLARFQQGEKKWLENCLRHEIELLKKLEADDQRLSEENMDHTRKMAEESRRIKEMNDRRRIIEEQKQRVAEAQQELEKEKAKKAFAEHQEALQKIQEKEAERKKQAHLKSLRHAEERARKEIDQKRQQDLIWEEKQAALREMQDNDLARLKVIEKCKGGILKRLSDRLIAKKARVTKSIEKNRDQERKRKEELMSKLIADQHRDERLAVAKHQQMEDSAKKSLELIVKRKLIQNESHKKLELRRQEIASHQEEIDRRLAEHEEKRNRYLDFKRELELLREKNKQLNVDRQRKKEKYLRDMYAKRIVEKDSKIEQIFAERQQLWEVRRKTALESQMSRDHVKRAIMDMRIKSKTDSKQLESYVESVLDRIGSDYSKSCFDDTKSTCTDTFKEDTQRPPEVDFSNQDQNHDDFSILEVPEENIFFPALTPDMEIQDQVDFSQRSLNDGNCHSVDADDEGSVDITVQDNREAYPVETYDPLQTFEDRTEPLDIPEHDVGETFEELTEYTNDPDASTERVGLGLSAALPQFTKSHGELGKETDSHN